MQTTCMHAGSASCNRDRDMHVRAACVAIKGVRTDEPLLGDPDRAEHEGSVSLASLSSDALCSISDDIWKLCSVHRNAQTSRCFANAAL
jgi:hypothetical protein